MIFCPLPWIHSAIRNNGDFRVCCQANVSASRGLIEGNEKDGALNARDHGIQDTRNSQTLKSIRKSMLEGRWPEACVRCEREESSQLRSRRIYENESWGHVFTPEMARELTDSDGGIASESLPLRFLDVRFGNKCNLKCRMCGPTDSDFWYQDQGDIWGGEFKDTHGKVKLEKRDGKWIDPRRTYDWYSDNSRFWEELEELGADLKKINIVGGEPLLIDQHYKFLESLVEKGSAGEVVLEYNTNLTVLPSKALELWKHFAKVRIGVSLDGYDKNNTYIRYPSKWSVIVRNLQRLNEADGPLERWMSATIQALNAFEIVDLMRWKLRESGLKNFNSGRKLPILTTHALHKPDFLSLRSLPLEVKSDVSRHYREFLDEMKTWASEDLVEKAAQLFRGYEKFMREEARAEDFQDFCNYTRKLDEYRGDSLEQGAPRLYQSLRRHGYL